MEVSSLKKHHLKPGITHDGSEEAKRRDKIANQITDDEIFHHAYQVKISNYFQKY
jgi:hypothetical protein